jgi:hypothetical protein
MEQKTANPLMPADFDAAQSTEKAFCLMAWSQLRPNISFAIFSCSATE